MPNERESFLTGVFLKKNRDTGECVRGASGAYLLSGNITKAALVDAVRLANDDSYDVTLWLDVESIVPKAASDKRQTRSGKEGPDGSLKLGPRFVPTTKPTAPPQQVVKEDAIPF